MPVQGQHLVTAQKMVQKQIMTHQLIQSIKLMAMPIVELQETIHEEVEKNPALEVVREAGEIDDLNALSRKIKEPQAIETDHGYQPTAGTDVDRKQQFLEGAISRKESLCDHLIAQLHLMKMDVMMFTVAERLVWNLDNDGFHREPPELMLNEAELNLLDAVLSIIRSLDPMGCACRDWMESLQVQAVIRGDEPELFEKYIRQAMPLLKTKKSDAVRISLRITVDDWEDLENYIRILNPFPGRVYNTDTIQYIVPDLVVRQEEGEFILVLNDEILPVLRMDPDFGKMTHNKEGDKATRRYITDHSQQARYFINSLTQRNNTLLKTANAIVAFQRDFFISGPRYLRPLTLKDIAGEIGYHETTVSRITTNKFIQTEWGVFELKYFFSNSISGFGPEGSRISKVAAKEVIKEILGSIGVQNRIPDQKISELLSKRGINLARRTVAKYRKELDFPSTFDR